MLEPQMKWHRMVLPHRLFVLSLLACAPLAGCASGDKWTPPMAGDESQMAEAGGSPDSTTTQQDSSSNLDDGSAIDSTVAADSADDTGSMQDDGATGDGATPDDTGTLPDADDTGAATDTAPADDSASDATADASPDVSSVDASDAGSDASDAASDASDAGLDASDAASDAREAGVDASEAGPVDAGVDAAKCNANILVPNAAVASSQMQPASNAIDGMFGTRWESVHGVDPQWIYLDYGAPVYISRIQIAWETACAKNYALQVSNDLVTWTTMTSIAGNTNGGGAPANWTTAANHPVLSGVGRYLRVNGTVRCTMYGYSMWEMRAFGDTNGTCTP
jgi:hypothetical protein